MFTAFYVLFSILAIEISDISESHEWWMTAILAVLLMFDVFTDTLCMTLSLPPNYKWYLKLCGHCHWNCCYGYVSGNDIKLLEMPNINIRAKSVTAVGSNSFGSSLPSKTPSISLPVTPIANPNGPFTD